MMTPALATFLDDRAALGAVRERAEACSRAWHQRADVRTPVETLNQAASGGGEAVQDALMALMADRDWVERLVAPLFRALRDDPWFDPPLLAVGDDVQRGVLLIESEAAAIVLVRLSAAALARRRTVGPAKSIAIQGVLGAIHVLEPGGARLRHWHAPPVDAGFSMATEQKLRQGEILQLERGQMLRVDGRTSSYTIEDAASDLLLLRASVRIDHAPYQREFDTTDGRMIAASAAREDASRTRMMLTMLRSMRCSKAGEVFAMALKEPEFDLRWHAMREWLLHDLAAATPALESMAVDDPHPEVRAAAAATCKRLAQRKAA